MVPIFLFIRKETIYRKIECSMKNKFLSLIVLFSIVLSMTGCGPLSKIFHKNGGDNTEIVAGTQNMYQIKHEYTRYQVDSMCVADNLPQMFEGWYRQAYQDYETGKYVIRYSYIKEKNNNNEMVYIVTERGDIYVVSKRKVVTE